MLVSGLRENSGAATPSLPPFFNRCVKSLTIRVWSAWERSVDEFVVSQSVLPRTCVSEIKADGWQGPHGMVKR